MWYKKNGKNELDVFAEKLGEGVHLHMFFNGDKTGAVLTNVERRGTQQEHIPFSMEDFLKILAQMCEAMFNSIRQIEPNDRRFSRKKVQICTIPKIQLSRIKGGIAYFELQTELEYCRFNEIDSSRPQIGVVKGWFGREIAMIFVANGSISLISLRRMKELSKEFEHKLSSLGWKN